MKKKAKKEVRKKKEIMIKKDKRMKKEDKIKKKTPTIKAKKIKKTILVKKEKIKIESEKLPITAQRAEEEERPEEETIEQEEEKIIKKAPAPIKKENTLKNDIEALLFSSGKPVPEELLCQLTGRTRREMTRTLQELKDDYSQRDTALMIIQDADSWKITVREKHLPLVQKIVADTELSRATLETLAVIAYKSPVLQSTVIKIRGTGAYDHITELLNLGFISRDKEGRSFKIKLAEKFFEYFDVEGSKDIKDVLKAAKQPVPKPEQTKLGDLQIVDVPAEGTPEASQPLKEDKITIESEKLPITAQRAEEEERPEEETAEDEPEEEKEGDEDTEKMLEDVAKEIDDLTKDDKDEETDSEEEKEDKEEDEETEDKEDEEQEETSEDEELEEEPKYKKRKRF